MKVSDVPLRTRKIVSRRRRTLRRDYQGQPQPGAVRRRIRWWEPVRRHRLSGRGDQGTAESVTFVYGGIVVASRIALAKVSDRWAAQIVGTIAWALCGFGLITQGRRGDDPSQGGPDKRRV